MTEGLGAGSGAAAGGGATFGLRNMAVKSLDVDVGSGVETGGGAAAAGGATVGFIGSLAAGLGAEGVSAEIFDSDVKMPVKLKS